jgi:hypothetical protein
MRIRHRYENLRCLVGLHRLRAHRGSDDSPVVTPIDARVRPGPHDWRVCEWCGARWEGAYDGISPTWKRV